MNESGEISGRKIMKILQYATFSTVEAAHNELAIKAVRTLLKLDTKLPL